MKIVKTTYNSIKGKKEKGQRDEVVKTTAIRGHITLKGDIRTWCFHLHSVLVSPCVSIIICSFIHSIICHNLLRRQVRIQISEFQWHSLALLFIFEKPFGVYIFLFYILFIDSNCPKFIKLSLRTTITVLPPPI